MQPDHDPAAVHLTALRDLCHAGIESLSPKYREGLAVVIAGHVKELSGIIRSLRAKVAELESQRDVVTEDRA